MHRSKFQAVRATEWENPFDPYELASDINHSKFHPVRATEHPFDPYDLAASASDDDNTTLDGVGRASRGPRTESPLQTTKALRILCVIMHLTLVAIHLVLVGVWSTQVEHRLVFALEHQKIVSLLITAIMTTFGTIYSALLVFVTQTLSMRRGLQRYQTLTATHDNAAAWSGIGSAVAQIWNQKAAPASVAGVLSVFLYLASILAFHITTPALFSLEAFTAPLSVPVQTQSLPAFNASAGYNLSNPASLVVTNYATSSLYFIPLGLSGGTLYDVLDINAGTGNVTVNAKGFNISCGYVSESDVNITFQPQDLKNVYQVEVESTVGGFLIPSTQPGIIANLFNGYHQFSNLLLYSTIPILDSSGTRGPAITLDPPMNTSISTIQVLRCSQTLVNQTAVPYPSINKTASVWTSGNPPLQSNATTGNGFLDAWATLYQMRPSSDFYLDSTGETFLLASLADLYLIRSLNLHPVNFSNARTNVTLHELENALSVVVASMFWTLGHIPPMSGGYNFSDPGEFTEIQEVQNPLEILRGTADVTVIATQTRLDVVAGLVASIALLLVALPFSLKNPNSEKASDVPLDGTGILHVIWLYRNHPELEQVGQPTDQNLREAGMVRTRLVGGKFGMRRLGRELFGNLQERGGMIGTNVHT
ncbi:hypothetical protein B0H14DRAFT_2922762 [Mycena olivaceomarginata]|nr:hypothetical protein B0H14DRAFT_2922762 [Mycena olivaceomarginata]